MGFGSHFRGGYRPGAGLPASRIGGGSAGPWKLREGMPDIAPMVFPNTAAGLIERLGSPAGWTDANVLAIYMCDTASPLVDSLGLGPNFNATFGLTGRRGNGIPYAGTLWGKTGVEGVGGGTGFTSALAGWGDINGNTRSFIVVHRIRSSTAGELGLFNYRTGVGNGYRVVYAAGYVRWYLFGPGASSQTIGGIAPCDDAWHITAFSQDDAAKLNTFLTDFGDVGPVATPAGSVSDPAASFELIWNLSTQVAYFAACDRVITRAMVNAFWEPMVRWSYPTDLFTTKTRTNRITVPVGYQPGVGQLVATYGAGQPARGFSMAPKQSQSALLAGTTLPLDWRQPTLQNLPPTRYGAGLAYDSARRCLYLAGGYTGALLRDDTWKLDLTSQEWTQISSGGYTGRYAMSLVYDPVRDRVVMFGGWDGAAASAATYEFDPATRQWTLMAPVASPAARFDHAATYDVGRSRVLIFGGYDGANPLGDTYEYDGATWTQVSAGGGGGDPVARRAAVMAYDPTQDRTLMFGGYSAAPAYLQETWAWNGATATWANLAPAAQPNARAWGAAWYDSVRQQVFTAYGYNGATYYADTWSYDWTANTWTQTCAVGATGRNGTATAFDDAHGITALFGGIDVGGVAFQDTWTYARGPVGLVAAARGSFLGIGSNNINSWTNEGATTSAVTDGPSGMRDATRVTMGAAWNAAAGGQKKYSLAAPVVGATSVPWYLGAMAKQATNGTTFRIGYGFQGDPVGWEFGTALSVAATGAEYALYGAAVTPVGNAHNTAYHTIGAAALNNNVDVAEAYLLQGTDQPAPYYLRVANATETVAAQTTSIAGAGTVGKYAPPSRGHLLFNLLGAPGATERMAHLAYDGTIWRALPAAGLAGELWVRCAPDVQVRVLDVNGEGGIVRTGYVPRAGEAVDVDVVWDAATALPVLDALSTDRVAIMINGTYANSGASGAWVPAAKASLATIKCLHNN